MHGAQETGDQDVALPAGAMLLREQIAEPLLEPVDEVQGWVFFQIGGEFELPVGAQVVAVPAHQRQQPPVLAGDGIDLAPAPRPLLPHSLARPPHSQSLRFFVTAFDSSPPSSFGGDTFPEQLGGDMIAEQLQPRSASQGAPLTPAVGMGNIVMEQSVR